MIRAMASAATLSTRAVSPTKIMPETLEDRDAVRSYLAV